jgi:hypothetical protein
MHPEDLSGIHCQRTIYIDVDFRQFASLKKLFRA